MKFTIDTDGNGSTTVDCPGCNRSRRGFCLDCSARVDVDTYPRPLRCARCRPIHNRKVRRDRERLQYRDNPARKKRACRKYRRANAKRLAQYARDARARERAAGPPTPIDRLYWREKQRRLRADPRIHAAELKRKKRYRCEARQRLEVAA